MASPTKENGYTPIANELLEQVYRLKLNGTQFKIIMVVWRYTYGFSRKEHRLSESFIAKATDIHKKQISRELNHLIKFRIINVESAATFTDARIVSFNKNYSQWELDNRQTIKTLPPNEKVNATPNEIVTTTGSELVTQDKQNIKQNIKQVYTPSKQVKHKYGEFRHVLLTDAEKGRLITELGQFLFDKCIIKLDEYIEMKGYKAKNHNLVIRKWVIDAVKEDEKKAIQKGETKTYGETYDTGGCYDLSYYDQFKSTN